MTNKPLKELKAEQPLNGLSEALTSKNSPIEQQFHKRWSTNLARSLSRLHHAVKGCARIGFEESSPTKNAEHYAVWMELNDAQKDAELKLNHYAQACKIMSDPEDDPSAGGGPPP